MLYKLTQLSSFRSNKLLIVVTGNLFKDGILHSHTKVYSNCYIYGFILLKRGSLLKDTCIASFLVADNAEAEGRGWRMRKVPGIHCSFIH